MGYTIKQKIDICLMAESNPEMTQADLANWARENYGTVKPPSQTTISRILSKKNELIALKEHEFTLIRRRKLTNPLLRKVLEEWVAQSVWDGIPITGPIIQSSAISLWKSLPENLREGNGEFSHKWCNHFFSKMDINLNNLENELSRPDKVWTFDEKLNLKNYIDSLNYKPKDIFTIDDFFLCYSLPLDKSYSEDNSFWGTTVMFGCNVDGSEKLEPLIVGNYENMVCFEGKPISKITRKYGINYKSNRKAWLTTSIFYDYLTVLDKRLSVTNRKILILIDDSASHRIINIKLESIKLIFTSSASGFLPMNWGIIEEFKILYRLTQYLSCINIQRNSPDPLKPLPIISFDVTLLNSFQWIKRAWDSISSEKILSCWKYSGVLNNLPSLSNYPNTKKAYFKLQEIMEQLIVEENWDISSLLNLQREKKNKYYISSDEIIESCIVDEWEPNMKNENSVIGIPNLESQSLQSLPTPNYPIINNTSNMTSIVGVSADEYTESLFQDSIFPDLNFENPQPNLNSNSQNIRNDEFNNRLFEEYQQNLDTQDINFGLSYQNVPAQRTNQNSNQEQNRNRNQNQNSSYQSQNTNQSNQEPNHVQSSLQNLNMNNLGIGNIEDISRKHNLNENDINNFKYPKLFSNQSINKVSEELVDVPNNNFNTNSENNQINQINHLYQNNQSNQNQTNFNSTSNQLILNPKRKIALLSAIINSTEQGDFKLSNNTINELKKVLLDNILELKNTNV